MENKLAALSDTLTKPTANIDIDNANTVLTCT